MAVSATFPIFCPGFPQTLPLLSCGQVGSIGVVSATFGAVDAAQRLGIQRRVYTAGEAKVQLDPFLPVSPEQVRGAALPAVPLLLRGTWSCAGNRGEARLGPRPQGCAPAAARGRPLCTASGQPPWRIVLQHCTYTRACVVGPDARPSPCRRCACATSWMTCTTPSRSACGRAGESAWPRAKTPSSSRVGSLRRLPAALLRALGAAKCGMLPLCQG